jgi:transcriptional regulator GlxA family with amidase domain
MPAQRTVGILLFDEVEVLDFAGPFEVFSRTRLVPGTASRRINDSAPFYVFTVAETRATVNCTGGLQVTPTHDFATAPHIDILVVPGGFGTRPLLAHAPTLEWIRQRADAAATVTSVCTGALLLAKLGLLRDRRATTHWGALDTLAELDPTITVDRDARVVHDLIFTSAGISAGIDMSLSVVEQLHGREVADETAHYMEFRRR